MNKNTKQNIYVAVTQLIAIALFMIAVIMMIKVEYIVLNPIPYFLGLGLLILILNALALFYIFRDKTSATVEGDGTPILTEPVYEQNFDYKPIQGIPLNEFHEGTLREEEKSLVPTNIETSDDFSETIIAAKE